MGEKSSQDIGQKKSQKRLIQIIRKKTIMNDPRSLPRQLREHKRQAADLAQESQPWPDIEITAGNVFKSTGLQPQSPRKELSNPKAEIQKCNHSVEEQTFLDIAGVCTTITTPREGNLAG